MNPMKLVFSLTLAALLALGLVGCSSPGKGTVTGPVSVSDSSDARGPAAPPPTSSVRSAKTFVTVYNGQPVVVSAPGVAAVEPGAVTFRVCEVVGKNTNRDDDVSDSSAQGTGSTFSLKVWGGNGGSSVTWKLISLSLPSGL